MTRLIDADHLKWNVGGIECGEITVEYLLWIIDHQEPTIEAIPISFLYEYMALCESVGAYKSKETIECLIDDWREENGEKDEC